MLALDATRSALLVMDLQDDVLGRLGEKAGPLLERTAALIAGARAARVPVIYVVVAFRPGYPEISPKSPMHAAIAGSGRLVLGTPGAAVATAVAPAEGEVVVVKKRVGAFSGTDLEVVLRAKGVDTLVLAGVATSGVVLSTVRHAFDADYRAVVVEDCCADPDDEVHRVLVQKVFARQATVAPSSDLIAALGGT